MRMPDHLMRAARRRISPLKFALLLAGTYLLFGLAWILFSDRAVESVITDVGALSRIQTAKGWFYVFFTAVLLFAGAWWAMASIENLLQRHALTGLQNRSLFTEYLQGILDRERNTGRTVFVSVMDIDHFRDINTGLGYVAGDVVLLEVARRLRAFFHDNASAHFGGDTFARVTVLDAPDAMERSSQDYERFREHLWRPIFVSTGEVEITGSVGTATSHDECLDATRLIRYAEIAQVEAQRIGGDMRLFYRPEWHSQMQDRRDLALALRRAIAESSITVVYQPQVDIASGNLHGVEVLARWTHPTLGAIPPERFVDAAERSSQIAALTSLVIRRALDELGQADVLGNVVPRVGLNISGHQFRSSDRLASLAQTLEAHRDRLSLLTLEVTESDALHGRDRARAFFQDMRERGATISIDDFGTGHSSLAQLKTLPIQELKIDRQFVMSLPEDQDDLIITRTVLAMGQSLNLRTVAEGVETAEQLALLRKLGCTVAQGYFIARPMPIGDLVEWLAARRSARGLLAQTG
jgi:diguanylate cyclase (GGDEF)-like protein